MRHFLALLSLATAALANTQIKFFWPSFDSEGSDGGVNPVATVLSANPSTTVMQLACPTDVDSTECGWGSGEITYSVISTTIYAASFSAPALDLSFGCTTKDAMTCVMTMPQSELGDLSVSGLGDGTMVTVTTTFDSVAMQTATVTAGEDKLKATGAGSAASTLATSASGTATASGPGANATRSGSPAQSTGAAGRFGVEGAALFALAGAAALNVL